MLSTFSFRPDLFGASYGSFDFYQQPKMGMICMFRCPENTVKKCLIKILFSLKNPSYPEYTCLAHCGVLSLDISTAYPHLVVAGLYDGNVAVYNLCRFYLTVFQVKTDVLLQKW